MKTTKIINKYIGFIFNLILILFIFINYRCSKDSTKPDDFVSPDSNIIFNEHIHKPIFLTDCASRIGCHVIGNPAAGLDLETVFPSFTTNSNRPNLIIEGHPEQSVLYLVLWDDYPPDSFDSNGISRMPKDRPILSDEKIKAIRIWIKEGAKITTASR
jgi:hypothetical protein